MTFAWYGHLKYGHEWPLWKAILVSWAIALLEYSWRCRNRFGYGHFSGFELKIIQEVITLVVFIGFAVMFLKEKLAWNYLAAFVCLARCILRLCVQGTDPLNAAADAGGARGPSVRREDVHRIPRARSWPDGRVTGSPRCSRRARSRAAMRLR